jgi:hypothetical protein
MAKYLFSFQITTLFYSIQGSISTAMHRRLDSALHRQHEESHV